VSDTVQGERAAGSPGSIGVAVSSFGFKFGLPPEAEWVADARMVRNPFWVPELRSLTGLEPSVRDYVLEDPVAGELIDRVHGLVLWSAWRFTGRKRDALNVAVGCTGGRHRSVAIVEALAARLRDDGLTVTVTHRDIDQPDPRYA
jgi:RNase adapter protein RapZ